MVRKSTSYRWWWGLVILLCLAMEAIALYYQYALNTLPCVLCIHVRMLLAAILVVAIIGLLGGGRKVVSILMLLITAGLWGWMVERSYQLLGVEQGWILGECAMASGLPQWLALESWFPWLFRIHEPCGYTPFLLFKVSMAEALIVLSPVMLLWTLYILFRRIQAPDRVAHRQ